MINRKYSLGLLGKNIPLWCINENPAMSSLVPALLSLVSLAKSMALLDCHFHLKFCSRHRSSKKFKNEKVELQLRVFLLISTLAIHHISSVVATTTLCQNKTRTKTAHIYFCLIFTALAMVVEKLRLMVCTGWGVCQKKKWTLGFEKLGHPPPPAVLYHKS